MTETSSVDVQQTDRHVGLKLQIQGNVENKDLDSLAFRCIEPHRNEQDF